MTIHFICTGNIYRSRLAEAYCASKRVAGLCVLSSGIGTKLKESPTRILREASDGSRFIVVHIKDGVTLGDQQEISDARGHAQDRGISVIRNNQRAADAPGPDAGLGRARVRGVKE